MTTGEREQLPKLLVRGMHGLGDNVHQRGVIRQLLPIWDVYLESSWVSVYHDLVEQGLKIVHKPITLRTQTKNARRESAKFYKGPPVRNFRVEPIWYRPREVNSLGSVVAAMCYGIKVDPKKADFRLPVPKKWLDRIDSMIASWNTQGKPIMVYRPLVERREWGGNGPRNPLFDVYAQLYEQIRELFYVVSIADLENRQEWMVGHRVKVDMEYHKGELDFELLAALWRRATLVFSSPGMAIPLAQAVSTPSVCVFGGFETGTSFSLGAQYAPHLPITPINPCGCWKHNHKCDKTIDVPKAHNDLAQFIEEQIFQRQFAVAG